MRLDFVLQVFWNPIKYSMVSFIFRAKAAVHLLHIVHRGSRLTRSSIYTQLNTLKKSKASGKNVEKGEIAQNEQFHLYPQCFLCNVCLKIL